MANLSITNTFVDGTTADADEVNTNFSDVRTYINARNGGSAKWDNVKSVAAITVDAASSQLVLGDTTINAAALASPLTYTIPDAGATASFLLKTASGVAMASSKLTGLAAGTTAGDSVRFEQLEVIQALYAETVATTSSTTLMVDDNSIPQSGEGFEVLTQAITPTSATSRIRIRAVIPVGSTAIGTLIIALFKDAGADALAANGHRLYGNGTQLTLTLQFEETAGSTSARTYKIRVGNSNASTTAINTSDGTTRFGGGVVRATLTVEEIAA